MILVTRHLSSVEKVTKFVTSISNASIRIIDTNIVTKYIIRDADTDFSIVDINNELSTQNIAAAKIVRFKKKGTSDPIPIVLVDEIGKSNRTEIKIGRLIFKTINKTSIEVTHDLYDNDHCPIFISLCNFGTKSLLTRKYINWGQFSKKINAHLLSQGEVSSLDEFNKIFQESAKSSSYSFTKSAYTHAPWWDVKCNHLKALKRKLLRKVKSYPSITNWAACTEMAAVLRKYVKSCKHSFWEKTCQEAASSHQAFRIVKALLNKDGSPSISILVLSSGITLTALTAQANATAASLIKKAPDERIPLDFSADYFEIPDNKTMNRLFSLREFHNALAKTRNKSPGID
ncbi:hypothetical protein AVEN_104887-1 [Araneus ventricosus]|uniref:Endonuclease/exonuclease/phosphatase domain-containing protein n=1 Tax=Araneus ventricosus TaxID=182803 RepID=A0A4Y2FFG1_ARAVE|nr:hypothetical protein AVEN_104887-1 [Araneus ventricosus]